MHTMRCTSKRTGASDNNQYTDTTYNNALAFDHCKTDIINWFDMQLIKLKLLNK